MTKTRRTCNRWAESVSVVRAHGFVYLRLHNLDGSVFAHARLRPEEAEDLCDVLDECGNDDEADGYELVAVH